MRVAVFCILAGGLQALVVRHLLSAQSLHTGGEWVPLLLQYLDTATQQTADEFSRSVMDTIVARCLHVL